MIIFVICCLAQLTRFYVKILIIELGNLMYIIYSTVPTCAFFLLIFAFTHAYHYAQEVGEVLNDTNCLIFIFSMSSTSGSIKKSGWRWCIFHSLNVTYVKCTQSLCAQLCDVEKLGLCNATRLGSSFVVLSGHRDNWPIF